VSFHRIGEHSGLGLAARTPVNVIMEAHDNLIESNAGT
jgi:hypothetical protein